MATYSHHSKLRIAVIGAGPAGLGAAIEFAKLPFVDVRVYEQAQELREVGTGISIQRRNGSIALVGDASHPLSGAFGAGAGFALEDVYVLTRAVKWAHERRLPIHDGLEIFDKVRSPYYKDMYAILDQFAATSAAIKGHATNFDEAVATIVKSDWSEDHNWLYHYDVQEVWRHAYQAEDARRRGQDN